jgi:23S rRNA (cytidine1920-2'-O)/16S rRNA (cytidine1409-2'-O)-methyltransferase
MDVVGRAEHKLAGALDAFGLDLRGKTVMDIGSSTGGFTELALRLGATRVIAVEKGTNQMKAPLRFDSRVDLHEKTDIFEFTSEVVPDVIVADVSFVSLVEVLRYVRENIADAHTEFAVMLKPQFEAKPWQLQKGVVKNSKMRREIIADFEVAIKRGGYVILGKRDNELAGRFGNVERFYHLKLAK